MKTKNGKQLGRATQKRNRKSRIDRRKLSNLKPHPLSAAAFGDADDPELELLVASIQREGLRNPIEILPDNIIICGHRRVEALKQLGRTLAEVQIRYDLEAEGANAVEQRMIEDNLYRRQLSPMHQARLWVRLLDVRVGRQCCRHNAKQRLRDYPGGKFNRSEPTLNRWLRVIDSPLEFQRAYEAGHLKLQDAGRALDLPEDDQREIIGRLRNGDPPEEVFRKLAKASGRGDKIRPAVRNFLKQLNSSREEMGSRLRTIGSALTTDDLSVLRSSHELLGRMIEYIETHPKECESFDDRLERMLPEILALRDRIAGQR